MIKKSPAVSFLIRREIELVKKPFDTLSNANRGGLVRV